MAVTDQQKIDFLLKKIGFTKTKTGSVVGTGAISGTGKQPFAEAIPSPLIIANGALWNESSSIPATPPGSDTNQVKVYLAGSSGLRMTADATSSGQRAYIAYTTYGNASSTRLTNWIDTQFGASYLIKVYKGDPNSGGVALSAAGSGANDGWFFDYSAGVLNFNDTSVPSGVTDTNIYIVGYRYIGQTGAPTSGISTFSYKDLFVERHLSVGGVSTFSSDVEFGGNVSIAGTLTYEDVSNIDSVGIITANKDIHVGAGVSAVGIVTAGSGMRVTGGVIEALSGQNKVPSLYSDITDLPNSTDYHGLFAHVHANGKAYFSHNMGATVTVTVGTDTVGGQSTGVFYFNGTEKPPLFPIIRNTTYIFDQSNSTNASYGGAGAHPLMFSTGAGGDHNGHGHYMTGITYKLDGVAKTMAEYVSGFVAATSRTVEWKVPANAPATLYYWCHHHTGQGNSFSLSDGAYLELVNKNKFGVTGLGTEVYNIGILTATSVTATGIDLNGDLDVDGHTNLDNLSVAGVTTFSGTVNTASIVATGIDLNGDIDVDGHTNLDNVSISGFATVTQDLNVDGHTNLDNVSIAGVVTGTNFHGNTFVGDGDFVELDVDGHTNLDNVSVAGVTTFAANTRFNSTITAGGSAGTNGNYLKTTGTGVEWASFPSIRTRQTFTASAGQTSFSFSYNVNYVDVYINGVKLTDAEFTATNGTSVVLAVGSFVGDIVEIVSYNTVSAGGGAYGIGNLVEDLSPQLGGNLDLFNKFITGTGGANISGVVTATQFKGDGSALTGIIAEGSGVVIKDSNSTVGTAGTINFGDNLSVSPISAGIVTITGSAGGGSTAETRANTLVVTGVSTLTNIDVDDFIEVGSNIQLGSIGIVTALTFKGNGDFVEIDVDGHTNLDNVNVAGVTTFTGTVNTAAISASGALTIADINASGGGVVSIKSNGGGTTLAKFTNGGSVELNFNNAKKLETSNTGVTVTGTVAATAYTGDGSQLTGISAGVNTSQFNVNKLDVSGISTFNGNVDVNADIDVDGHTNLDNVSIAGVTTFSGEVVFDTHPTRIKSTAGDLTIGVGNTSSFFITGGPYTSERFETTADCVILYSDGTKVARTHNGRFEIGNPQANIGVGATFGVTGNALFGGTGIVTATSLELNSETQSSSTTTGALVVDGGVGVAKNLYVGGAIIGDGSGLTGITASGSGVVIKNNGNTVGTAGTINFGEIIDVSAISGGSVTVGVSTSQFNVQKLNVSGITTTYQLSVGAGGVVFNSNSIYGSSRLLILGGGGGDTAYYSGGTSYSDHIFRTMQGGSTIERFRIGKDGDIGLLGENYGTSGQVLTSGGSGAAASWTTISAGTDVGITTNLSGTFNASAGTPATINTLTGYSANDLVVEYTIYIKNGSDFQSQKLLAMRDGTTIHSTQFAVMFSSSLLVQCDATISSGNILLRATPETGVSGSTTYKIKREVM